MSGLRGHAHGYVAVAYLPPASLRRRGAGQHALVGTTFSQPLRACVTEQSGDPIAGVTVTFSTPSTGPTAMFAGGLHAAAATTDANGVATSPVLTAGDEAGRGPPRRRSRQRRRRRHPAHRCRAHQQAGARHRNRRPGEHGCGDRFNYGEDCLRARIVVTLGGRTAESLVYGVVTTGAENDLEQVTQIAHEMVVRRGMSPRIGPVNYSEAEGAGGLYAARRPYGETTAQLIEDEVSGSREECAVEAREILEQHRDQLDALVGVLLDHDSLGEREILEVTGLPLPPLAVPGSPHTGSQWCEPHGPEAEDAMRPDDKATDLLPIRAYATPGSRPGLRTEVHISTDISSGEEYTLELSDPAEVLQAVRAWLGHASAPRRRPGDTGPSPS